MVSGKPNDCTNDLTYRKMLSAMERGRAGAGGGAPVGAGEAGHSSAKGGPPGGGGVGAGT